MAKVALCLVRQKEEDERNKSIEFGVTFVVQINFSHEQRTFNQMDGQHLASLLLSN